MNYCIREKGLRVNAYVIMPNHVHMIVFDRHFDNERLQQAFSAFRKYTGRSLADYIDKNMQASLGTKIRKTSLTDRGRQVWQPGWHAEGLVGERFWEQKMNYIHENPVRKGYVGSAEFWRYSSAGYWLNGEIGSVPIVPVDVEE